MPAVYEWSEYFTTFRERLSGHACDENSWRIFLCRFNELLTSQKLLDARLTPKRQIAADEYEQYFIQFKPEIQKYYKFGHAVNVWDVAGVKNDEVRISTILCWLLDCNGSHGQGNVFLEALLHWLAEDKNIPQQARSNLPSPGATKGFHYWTRVESLPLGEKESRVDIEIGGPFVLFIEVKINAAENGDQLKRYADIAREKAINKKWGVLFLTRYGSLPADESLHDKVCRISWRQMTSAISNATKENVPLGSFIEHQINQFCQHIKAI